jgi:hypothetical protein
MIDIITPAPNSRQILMQDFWCQARKKAQKV